MKILTNYIIKPKSQLTDVAIIVFTKHLSFSTNYVESTSINNHAGFNILAILHNMTALKNLCSADYEVRFYKKAEICFKL